MIKISHKQTLTDAQISSLSQIARFDIIAGNNGPTLLIHDPVSECYCEIQLNSDLFDTSDFEQNSFSTNQDMTSLTLNATTRQLDTNTLERLIDGYASTSAYLDGVGFFGNTVAIHALTQGGENYIYVARSTGDTLTGFKMTSDGNLQLVSSVTDSANTYLDNISSLASIQIGANTFLLAASISESGVSVLQVGDNGTLATVSSFGTDESLPLEKPAQVMAVNYNGHDFVVLASFGTSSLTILEIDATGELTFIDQINDTLNTRFGGAAAMDIIKIEDQVLIAIAGNDGGISLFQLLPNGRLILTDTLVDETYMALGSVKQLRFAVIDGDLELFALANGEAGLTRLQIDIGDTGITAESRDGTNHNDILLARGNDTINGAGGDDIIIDGTGQNTLTGGNGADLFIFQADDNSADTILDFDIQQDTIDLSAYQELSSLNDLRIQTTSTGAIIWVNGDKITLVSHDKTTINATALHDAIQLQPSHTIMPKDIIPSEPEPITGTSSSDNLTGSAADDTINGLDGNDWITPGSGSDIIDGGAGSDMVSFYDHSQAVIVDFTLGTVRSGADTNQISNVENITGSIFGDWIRGDDNDNRLRGLGDYDWFIGSGGNDTYEGGTGRDMVSYVYADARVVVDLGAGAGLQGQAAGDTYDSIERITGSIYSDLFYGSDGADDFRGLGGYDWFVGSGGGKDRYYGGSGKDTVSYAASDAGVTASIVLGRGSAGDADRDLYFEIENLTGTNFNDELTGDNGRNILRGMYGEDRLFGLGGNDRMTGGGSDDYLDGGDGWDFAIFSGNQDEYTISTANGITTVDRILAGGEGTDTLVNIEEIIFADGSLFI